MTEALTTSTGIVTRLIHTTIGPVIPVVDLADKIGYSRTSLTNIITKNPDLFKGFTIYESLQTPGGSQQFLCVNSTGADRLILLMKPSKNRKEIFERVEAFRANAFGHLMERKEIVQKPAEDDPLDEVVAYELREAKQIARLTDMDPKPLYAAALKKLGYKEYADAILPPAPAITHGEAGIWLNPTQIGARCGHTAREVNNFLEWHRFQYRGPDGIWRLTDLGELHGEEYSFESVSKHIEIRIRWRESILYASGLLKDPAETLTGVCG